MVPANEDIFPHKIFHHSFIRIPSANIVTQNCETGGRQLQLVVSSGGPVTVLMLVKGNFTLKLFGFVKFCYYRFLPFRLLHSDERAGSYLVLTE